ncbi:hypothetical protein [Polyangium sp. y55x31]|uniref:hypothetical protein n=1 Tax=Polyangium sp. y55x31 TaxID=3042688 RepID=UPI002482A226|nr:hypothetical protein [Polyangium sp. y55x31]MDI1477824.1 hypothetical protein [Polyangium sp. y55x31]
MNSNDLPPLPEKLEEEIRALRQVKPPQALVERVFSGLPERSASERRASANVPAKPPQSGGGSAFVRLVPAMALAAALVYGVWGHVRSGGAEVVRVEERAVALPEDGHAWTELHLQTQHHDGQPTLVSLEVPTHVRVELPSESDAKLERQCVETRCVHKFTHHNGKGVPLRVAVAHPGRYEIHVRHESKKAALREQFVLTASRD